MTLREHFQQQLRRGTIAFCASILVVLALVATESFGILVAPGWLLVILGATGVVWALVTVFRLRCPRCNYGLWYLASTDGADVTIDNARGCPKCQLSFNVKYEP